MTLLVFYDCFCVRLRCCNIFTEPSRAMGASLFRWYKAICRLSEFYPNWVSLVRYVKAKAEAAAKNLNFPTNIVTKRFKKPHLFHRVLNTVLDGKKAD